MFKIHVEDTLSNYQYWIINDEELNCVSSESDAGLFSMRDLFVAIEQIYSTSLTSETRIVPTSETPPDPPLEPSGDWFRGDKTANVSVYAVIRAMVVGQVDRMTLDRMNEYLDHPLRLWRNDKEMLFDLANKYHSEQEFSEAFKEACKPPLKPSEPINLDPHPEEMWDLDPDDEVDESHPEIDQGFD